MRQFQDAISLVIKDKSTEPQLFGTCSLHGFLWENGRGRNVFPIRACGSDGRSPSFAPAAQQPPQEQSSPSRSPPGTPLALWRQLGSPSPFPSPTLGSAPSQAAWSFLGAQGCSRAHILLQQSLSRALWFLFARQWAEPWGRDGKQASHPICSSSSIFFCVCVCDLQLDHSWN